MALPDNVHTTEHLSRWTKIIMLQAFTRPLDMTIDVHTGCGCSPDYSEIWKKINKKDS